MPDVSWVFVTTTVAPMPMDTTPVAQTTLPPETTLPVDTTPPTSVDPAVTTVAP